MAFKAVIDTTGLNGLVPTLLLFEPYTRINSESPPSPSTLKRADAIQKAMRSLQIAQAKRQINDAMNTRNGSLANEFQTLPLQSEFRVCREKDGWQGPFKIIVIDGHNVAVNIVNCPITFRCTVVKPYYCDPGTSFDPPPLELDEDDLIVANIPPAPPIVQPRRRGRPPGSKNKFKSPVGAFITMKSLRMNCHSSSELKASLQLLALHLRNLMPVGSTILLAEAHSNLRILPLTNTLDTDCPSLVWSVKSKLLTTSRMKSLDP